MRIQTNKPNATETFKDLRCCLHLRWLLFSSCLMTVCVLLCIGIAVSGPFLQDYWRLDNNQNVYRFSTGVKLSCAQSLLQEITLVGEGHGTHLIHSSGCKLRNITQQVAWKCTPQGIHIVFIGDSRVRQLFCYFHGIWSGNTAITCHKFQDDLIQRLGGAHPITVEFRWRPHVNSTLAADFQRWLSQSPDKRPGVIIAGAGVWRMRESHASVKGEVDYRDNLAALVPYMADLRKHSHVIWIPQDPVDETILDERRRMLSNKLVNRYNLIARDVLEAQKIPLWWSSLITAGHFRSFSRDCVHIHSIVDKYKSQILVNWFCQSRRNSSDLENCCEM